MAGGLYSPVRRCTGALLALAASSTWGACKPRSSSGGTEASLDSAAAATADPAATADGKPTLLSRRRLHNKAAYIPAQCFTKTRGDDGKPKNPCYACHTRS